MKVIVDIPDYMLEQLLRLRRGSPMSFDDAIVCLIAKEYQRQQQEETKSKVQAPEGK